MPYQAVHPEKVEHGFVLELHPVFSLFIQLDDIFQFDFQLPGILAMQMIDIRI